MNDEVPAPPPADGTVLDTAQMLRALVESAEDAVVTKSPLGVLLTWNAAASRLFGYSAEEALGRHVALIVPPDRLAEEEAILRRLLAGDPVRRFETQRLRRDGTRFPAELWLTPIRDGGGKVVGGISVVRDLTAQKAAEAALREEEARFQTLANNMSQLAWMANAQGWIFWYNQRWFDYTGTSLAEMQGWGWRKVHHPDHVERVVQRIQRAWDTGEPWEDVFPLRGRDGAFRWFLSRAMPIHGEDGAIVRWFGTNTDITDERRLQDELRELTRELAQSNRRKDEFLAALSHELRNPLGAVRTSLALLRAPAAGEAVRANALVVAERQVAQLARLLDDLLDTSRSSRGEMALTLAPVDLRTALEDAVAATAPQFATAGVALSVDLPAGPWPAVADAARVQQAVANVLANAARYTPAGGHTWLRATCVGHELVVEVRDDGVGIAPEFVPRVFELYVQCQPNTAAAKVGLGVGLYLSRAFLEMHGGTIDVASPGLGHGATFVIRLPVLRPDLTLAPTSPMMPAVDAAESRRVLVVDDDRDNAAAMAGLLRLGGHLVEIAHDGAAALAIARRQRPEAVLLDLGMPGMDGYATCAALRAAAIEPRPLIVAVSGWAQPHDLERSRAAGFDRHLAKPVEPQAILDLLRAPVA